jgi:hypothetical protein
VARLYPVSCVARRPATACSNCDGHSHWLFLVAEQQSNEQALPTDEQGADSGQVSARGVLDRLPTGSDPAVPHSERLSLSLDNGSLVAELVCEELHSQCVRWPISNLR